MVDSISGLAEEWSNFTEEMIDLVEKGSLIVYSLKY
jgi:hypothetical protein